MSSPSVFQSEKEPNLESSSEHDLTSEIESDFDVGDFEMVQKDHMNKESSYLTHEETQHRDAKKKNAPQAKVQMILLSQDIHNSFMRAAFEGNQDRVVFQMRMMNEEENNHEDIWSKHLMAFFLSVQSNQVETARFLFNSNEFLQSIIKKIESDFKRLRPANLKEKLPLNQQFAINMGVDYRHHSILDIDSYRDSLELEELQEANPKENAKEEEKVPLQESNGVTPRDLDSHLSPIQSQKKSQLQPSSPGYTKSVTLRLKKNNSEQQPPSPIVSKSITVKQLNPDKIKQNLSSEEAPPLKQLTEEYDIQISGSDSPIKLKTDHFKTAVDLKNLRKALKSVVGENLTANLLKVALNYHEDSVAALILAKYNPVLNEQVLDFAVSQNSIHFFKMFFTLGRQVPYSNPKQLLFKTDSPAHEFFNIETFIRKLCDEFTIDQRNNLLKAVLEWRLNFGVNLLKLLNELDFENLSIRYMTDFTQFATFSFFWHSMVSQQEVFVKHALLHYYFNWDYLAQPKTIDWILNKLKQGFRLTYFLNLLLYTDFRKWSLTQIHKFTSIGEQIITLKLDQNSLLTAHNPVMLLCFVTQYLIQIKRHFNILDMKCVRMMKKIFWLGRRIIKRMPFDQVEDIFMERDFLDRTVLSMITENDIKLFIVKAKVGFLIEKIWGGKDSALIDGKLAHFSRTAYLMHHHVRHLPQIQISFGDIIAEHFKPNIHDFNFIYQRKFRSQSIQFIFIKDFVCASAIIIMFQYINYNYLVFFGQKRYINLPDYQSQWDVIHTNLQSYRQINFWGTILSISYFLSFLYRVIYNTYSFRKIYFDIWMVFDILAGIVNIMAFNIVGKSTPDDILNVDTKRFYDYYMIIVLLISWLRFFSYFLVVNRISKITITLFRMLFDSLSFLLIILAYMLLATTVFATLFRNVTVPMGDQYSNLATSLRQMFDFFFAAYQFPQDMGSNFNTSHSVLYIGHVVICTIFLLNFIVAILSQVYTIMIKHGDFYSIQYQYIFITKYMKALEENNGYHQLVLYPPPLNFLLLPMLLVFPSRRLTVKAGRLVQTFFFWFENFFVTICFLFYLIIALNPRIYGRILLQIVTRIYGRKKLLYLFLWAFFGWVFLIYINLTDLAKFMSILCLEHAESFSEHEEEKQKVTEHKSNIYATVVESIRRIDEVLTDAKAVFAKREQLKVALADKNALLEKPPADKSLAERLQSNWEVTRTLDDLDTIRREVVICVYTQLSAKNPYIKSYRHAYQKLKQARKLTSIQVLRTINHTRVNERKRKLQNMKQVLSPELTNLISRQILQKNQDNLNPIFEFMIADGIRNHSMNITAEENVLINQLLSKFTIVQSNRERDSLNIKTVLKAIPAKLNDSSIHMLEQLNFHRMQKILIRFFNDDQDEMFSYYDARLKRRLKDTHFNSEVQDSLLTQIKALAEYGVQHQHRKELARMESGSSESVFVPQGTMGKNWLKNGLSQVTEEPSYTVKVSSHNMEGTSTDRKESKSLAQEISELDQETIEQQTKNLNNLLSFSRGYTKRPTFVQKKRQTVVEKDSKVFDTNTYLEELRAKRTNNFLKTGDTQIMPSSLHPLQSAKASQ